MKIEIGNTKPDNFVERWPGEFRIFSHYEMALGIPHALFLLTTLKENGQPNVCFQSWSSFSGDGDGFYAVTPICHHMHSHKNILRAREFCVNFISESYYDACYETVFHNEIETDEIAAGGFTLEPARLIQAPRIQEAFLSLECTLVSATDLSQSGITSLIIGKVIHAAMEETHLNGSAMKYGKNGFMFYLNELNHFAHGNQGERKVGILHPSRNG